MMYGIEESAITIKRDRGKEVNCTDKILKI
jgi:hypothetical protein